MYLHKSHRPTWAEINLSAIHNNLEAVQNSVPENTLIMGVVKADAYGHGAVEISHELLKLGVEYLAVSNIDEAMELRDAGVSCPMLLFGTVGEAEFGKIIQFNLYPTVTSLQYAKVLAESYKYRGIFPKVHILVDTGMGRLGIPLKSALLQIEQISKIDGLIIDGVYSHFPSAEKDIAFSNTQVKNFSNLIGAMKKLGIKVKNFHIANSAGVFNLPNSAKPPFNMVRVGLSLYGYSTPQNKLLQNSLSLKTLISEIRKMKKGESVSYGRTYTIKRDEEYIAVLPIGYADGIPTVYSNKGKVIIGKYYYPIVGRISMDYIMVSLGANEQELKVDDEAIIFGKGKLTVEKFGKSCGKIPYEVSCAIGKRVPRIYIRKEDER